jgi:ribosomal protein L40E
LQLSCLILAISGLIYGISILDQYPDIGYIVLLFGFVGIVAASVVLAKWSKRRRNVATESVSDARAPFGTLSERERKAFDLPLQERPQLPQVEKALCHYCGTQNDIDAVFCQECGKDLTSKQIKAPPPAEIFCKYCGTNNKSNAAYCKKCGKKLSES